MKNYRSFLVLCIFATASLLIVACTKTSTTASEHVGTILSLSPAQPFVNDTVIAHGINFGDMHMAGMIRCAGMDVTMISWSDTAVCFKAPDMPMTGNLEIQCSCGGTAKASFPIVVKAR